MLRCALQVKKTFEGEQMPYVALCGNKSQWHSEYSGTLGLWFSGSGVSALKPRSPLSLHCVLSSSRCVHLSQSICSTCAP